MNDQQLIRFITHRCTPEETKQIEEWISLDKKNAEYLFEMEHFWGLKNEAFFSDEQEIETAYGRFISQIRRKSKARFYLSWGKYAAMLALIILFSINIYMLQQWNSTSGMNVIEVPKGEMATLTLSDGTKVWLNADTKFSYPSHFMAKNREVIIEGEGYFDVSPNKRRPFIVKGDMFNVNVLGTKFNIKAHKDEDAEISLKSGKIEVNRTGDEDKKIILNPNEQLCYTIDGRTILAKRDMSSIDSWSRGETAFYSQPLSVITKTLERKYNVSIMIKGKNLENEVFTCRTRAGVSLIEVLNLLKDTQRIEYGFDHNNNIIITKKQMLMEN